MNDEKSISWKKLQEKWLTRRNLIRGAAGTAAGAGLLLGSGLRLPALADDEDEGHRDRCKAVPRPITHISSPPGAHFFFPGPVDASPTTSPNTGHDPSVITDFSGMIANADLIFSGVGTDLNTGMSASYDFHADMRFMDGVFVGLDSERHRATIGFI
ncbi:MAG TPA: hypothetical protein VG075_17390 [Candidatus Acidoferrum sp.]|jgi:hypothetical protein|nr:hypothetical protein [Candidatus Acidoferrum sp.]